MLLGAYFVTHFLDALDGMYGYDWNRIEELFRNGMGDPDMFFDHLGVLLDILLLLDQRSGLEG